MSKNTVDLAIGEARFQKVEVNIVLATIEAETEFSNILGDSGNAMGFGQVWPAWWMSNFQYAADRMGFSLPSGMDALRQKTTSDDYFSMIVTVKTIKDIWLSSNKDWRKFTLSYVGAGIPQSDYDRRYKIWQKYANGDPATAAYASSGGSSTSSSYTSSSGGSGATDESAGNYSATNFQVSAGAVQSGSLQYGRRYRIIVSSESGVALDVSKLHCVFSVTKTMLMQPNYSEVDIYNLNPETENSIIREGYRIVIEAGYEGENYGMIYDGDVIQAIRDKEEGVTYKLTLRCLDSDRFMSFGFANMSILRGQSSRNLIETITNQASIPSKINNISQDLAEAKLTRGKVVFGLAKDYLRQLAKTENATYYMEDGKVNIVKMTDLPSDEIITLSPTSGLLEVPAQSEFGVNIKCLMNPRIKPLRLIHIDNSVIRQLKVDIGQIVRSLDADGIYRVLTVTYKGDTRGNDWYCECETISQAGGMIPGMLSQPTANPW